MALALLGLNFGDFSVPNAVFTTLVIGGLLYHKLHRLRLTLQTEIAALRQQTPPIMIGEIFVAEHIEALERLVQELAARVMHVEQLIEQYQPGSAE